MWPFRRKAQIEQRTTWPNISIQQYLEQLQYLGSTYALPFGQTIKGDAERISSSFRGYAAQGYQGNGVVFACLNARMRVASEARFQFQQLRQGRPGNLFGTDDLSIFESPWPGGTTGDLLAIMVQDADLAGNAFIYRDGSSFERLRPDWTAIVLGSRRTDGLGKQPIAYIYQEGGFQSANDAITLPVERVGHFMPIPDPLARYRGMSWLSPIVREIDADTAANE